MTAIEETAIVRPDGSIALQHPDLHEGDQVKVIVLIGTAPNVGSGRTLKQG